MCYLFIISLDYVIRTSIDIMKDNDLKVTKKRSRRYTAQTIIGAHYADNIAFLANTLTQAENLLHSLERAAACIGLHINADKTEYMCFNQRGDISTLNGSSLKLHMDEQRQGMDSYRYRSVIWKSNVADKIKRSFFWSCRYCYMDVPYGHN